MNWPRGKYNGQRIGGFTVKLEINLLWWVWHFAWTPCAKTIHLGPVHLWFEAAYEK